MKDVIYTGAGPGPGKGKERRTRSGLFFGRQAGKSAVGVASVSEFDPIAPDLFFEEETSKPKKITRCRLTQRGDCRERDYKFDVLNTMFSTTKHKTST